MAKTSKSVTSYSADTEKSAVKYAKEFEKWKADLKPYWKQMEMNEEMYQFYKREWTETRSDVSLNAAFTIIESQLAKENEATISVTVRAKGEANMDMFENWVASTLKSAIEDPDVAQIKGTFRKIKERFSRQLKVVGNSVAEVGYCYSTQVVDGEKKVVADNPYVKNRHWKSIIFNPTRQFDNSDVYYLEDFVKFSDIKGKEYSETKGEDGSVSKKGLYKNLDALKKSLKDSDKYTDDDSVQYISGNSKIQRKNEPIQLLTRWEGTKMCVIANGNVLIREETDPYRLGGHNLLLAMRYVVEGRPYAYGEIDAIYKPVRAQDTIMNQSIEIVNKYLRGSYILGPSIDVDNFLAVLDEGGAMQGDPSQVSSVPVNVPPQQAFQSIEMLEQVIERVARYSPYASGTASSSTDKTQGTASGIQSLQKAAEPNTESQIDDIEDMFMRPLARMYLKMIAYFMSPDEIRYSIMKGQTKEWVKATKGVLQGKATIPDMVLAGVLSEDEAQEYLMTINPMTGIPEPIPGADKAYIFDTDWIVDVDLDNQSAADKEEKTRKDLALIQMGMGMGVQFDPQKTIEYFARKQDFEEIEDLIIKPSDQGMPLGAPQGQPPMAEQIPPPMPQESLPTNV